MGTMGPVRKIRKSIFVDEVCKGAMASCSGMICLLPQEVGT
jgi:hypothetical protein